MYTPPAFRETNQAKLHDFIERNSFATLISVHAGQPIGSHLPLLLDRHEGTHGMLVGHMARANTQWTHSAGQQVMAVFTGPHTYISPAWYESDNVVPTWNYVAVHAYGVLRLQEDRAQLLEIVRRTVDVYEEAMEQRWSLAHSDADFVDGLLDGIVGFTIEIERLEGKWKLNQNHDRRRRQRVVAALRRAGGEDRTGIAEMMQSSMSAGDAHRQTPNERRNELG